MADFENDITSPQGDFLFFGKNLGIDNITFTTDSNHDHWAHDSIIYEHFINFCLTEFSSNVYTHKDITSIISCSVYYAFIIRLSLSPDTTWPNIERDLVSDIEKYYSGDKDLLYLTLPIIFVILKAFTQKSATLKRFVKRYQEFLVNSPKYRPLTTRLISRILKGERDKHTQFKILLDERLTLRFLKECGQLACYIVISRKAEDIEEKDINMFMDKCIKALFNEVKGNKELTDYYNNLLGYAIWPDGDTYKFNDLFMVEVDGDQIIVMHNIYELKKRGEKKKKVESLLKNVVEKKDQSQEEKIGDALSKLEEMEYTDGKLLIRKGNEWFIPARILEENKIIDTISDFESYHKYIKRENGITESNISKFGRNFILKGIAHFVDIKKPNGIKVKDYERYIAIAKTFSQLLENLDSVQHN